MCRTMIDLGYVKRQVMFARGANARLQTLAVDDALSRALEAIERIAERLAELEADDEDTPLDTVVDHGAVTVVSVRKVGA